MAGTLIKLDEEIVSSSVSSVTLGGADWDTSYDVYLVKVINGTTDTNAQAMRLSFTASSSADTSSNYDKGAKNVRADSAFSNISQSNDSYIDLGNIGTGTQEVNNIIQYLFNFNNASEYSFTTFEVSLRQDSGHCRGFQGGGVLTVTQATDGVTYFMPSGNITGGTFSLYGIKK